ncbi:zinc finger, CCHC-type, retrotransposon gag domain protein [Tanacetum coccineum]|uniref:Zinc finger, CCHC-type, retrotransposon gag domain protein n=1 Tax=Tanacetum coccineum TaxID=301880 RepID=A0ABQ5GPN6_9ASTR
MAPRRRSVNNRADPAFATAVEQAVAALLPSLTAQITNEIRQGENNKNNRNQRNDRRGKPGSLSNDVDTQHTNIHVWLERFQKQRPQTFNSASTPVEAENWIAHIKRIFEVLGCDDQFKARFATYKLEGDAHSWSRQEGYNKRNRDGHRIQPVEPPTLRSNQRKNDRRDNDRHGINFQHKNNDRYGNNDRRKFHLRKTYHKATRACFKCGQVRHLAKDCKKGDKALGVLDSNGFKFINENDVLRVLKGSLVVMKATKGSSSLYTLQDPIESKLEDDVSEKVDDVPKQVEHVVLGDMDHDFTFPFDHINFPHLEHEQERLYGLVLEKALEKCDENIFSLFVKGDILMLASSAVMFSRQSSPRIHQIHCTDPGDGGSVGRMSCSPGTEFEIQMIETYVKAKDLDLWHIILNGDFPPIARNKETQVLEMVPFEQQDDDLKKKLAKNNEAKMVLYNALPKKEYEN